MGLAFGRLVAVPLLASSLSAFAFAAGAGPKVVLGDLTWDEPRAVNAVLSEILRTKFDAEIELIGADQSAIFAAMALGDGSVDVHPAVWSAAQQANIDRYVTDEATVRLNKAPYLAEDGWYVPRYMAEEHGIKSVSDLATAEAAALFDVNGDGRGDFWPGAPGWGVANIYNVKAKSFGLTDFYDPLVATDALLKAQLETSYPAKKGVLFYYWTPEALHQSYDLVKLGEPPFTGYAMETMKDDPAYNPDGCYNFVDPADDADWLEKSSITCATPAQPIYIAFSTALEKRAPDIAAFLSNVAIKPEEVGVWIYEMTVNGKSPEDMASAWVAANPERVASWTAK